MAGFSGFSYVPGLRQMFGADVQVDCDLATDTYTVRYTAGNTTLSRRFTAEELADMSYPGPHTYQSFPGSACSTGLAWGMTTSRSLHTVLKLSNYQWSEQFMGMTRMPVPATHKPVPPSSTVQLHDSPNLKWLRRRIDEIRVPLENLS